MKIVHISTYPPRDSKHSDSGGVASYTKNLITSTPYYPKDKIYILCNKINGFDSYDENGYKIIRCFDKNFKFIYQILREVNNLKPDTVHIQQELSLYGNVVTSFLLQFLVLILKKYNTIITLHGVVSLRKINKKFVIQNNSNLPVFLIKIAFLIIYKPLIKYSRKIIVHEQVFKDILINEYGAEPDKIYVIPHGVEDFKPISSEESRKHLNLPLNKKIVLFMGYLTGYKGLDLLIEGFSKFLKNNKDAILIIGAGQHPKLKNDQKYLKEYSRIRNKASNLIGKKNHIWRGFIDEIDIKYYYCASDLSIFPYTSHISSSGPMSISIGYEKPFLASDVFSDFVSFDLALFKQNPYSLSSSLEYFFKNRQLYLDYITEIKKIYLWGEVGEKSLKLYYSNSL